MPQVKPIKYIGVTNIFIVTDSRLSVICSRHAISVFSFIISGELVDRFLVDQRR